MLVCRQAGPRPRVSATWADFVGPPGLQLKPEPAPHADVLASVSHTPIRSRSAMSPGRRRRRDGGDGPPRRTRPRPLAAGDDPGHRADSGFARDACLVDKTHVDLAAPGTRRSAPAVPPAASPISAGAPRQPKPQAPRRRPGPNGCRAAEGPGQPPFRLDRAARERGRRPRPPSARPPSWLLPENHHPGQDAPFPDPLTCMTRSSIRWRSCRGSERGLNDLTTPERGDTERHGCGGSVDGHAE